MNCPICDNRLYLIQNPDIPFSLESFEYVINRQYYVFYCFNNDKVHYVLYKVCFNYVTEKVCEFIENRVYGLGPNNSVIYLGPQCLDIFINFGIDNTDVIAVLKTKLRGRGLIIN